MSEEKKEQKSEEASPLLPPRSARESEETKVSSPPFAKARESEESKPSSSPFAKAREPESLEKKLEECEKLKSEYLAGWQRSRADFLNYKKEEIERIEQILKYGGEEFILKILPILDNFDLAEKKLPEGLKDDQSVKGLLQIKTQLEDFLKAEGVEEIKSKGEKFDPNLHEAAEEVEVKDNGSTGSPQEKSGIIIEEIQKGYKINGRLLRPAKVKVIK